MTYIDPLMKCIPNGQFRWNESCHMWADTVEELHAFASRIGLRRAWFQMSRGARRLPHYDLNPSRRAKAIAAGAIELDRRAARDKWDELGFTRSAVANA
jgi:hypothetical protein